MPTSELMVSPVKPLQSTTHEAPRRHIHHKMDQKEKAASRRILILPSGDLPPRATTSLAILGASDTPP